VLAAVIQQTLADVLPYKAWSIELDRIEPPNLDRSKASQTFNAKQIARDFAKPALLNRKPAFAGGALVGQDRIPPSVGGGASPCRTGV
jgi:hypothetical protein